MARTGTHVVEGCPEIGGTGQAEGWRVRKDNGGDKRQKRKIGVDELEAFFFPAFLISLFLLLI